MVTPDDDPNSPHDPESKGTDYLLYKVSPEDGIRCPLTAKNHLDQYPSGNEKEPEIQLPFSISRAVLIISLSTNVFMVAILAWILSTSHDHREIPTPVSLHTEGRLENNSMCLPCPEFVHIWSHLDIWSVSEWIRGINKVTVKNQGNLCCIRHTSYLQILSKLVSFMYVYFLVFY